LTLQSSEPAPPPPPVAGMGNEAHAVGWNEITCENDAEVDAAFLASPV